MDIAGTPYTTLVARVSTCNPFSRMLIGVDPDRFYGRETEVDLILQGVCAPEPQSFSLQGIRAMGKTALLKYLCHPDGALRRRRDDFYGASDGPGKVVPLYIDCYGLAGDDIFAPLLKAIQPAAQTDRPPRSDVAGPLAASKVRTKEGIAEAMRACAEGGVRLVVCLDHFDRAYASLSHEDDSFLRALTGGVDPSGGQAFVLATERLMSSLKKNPLETSPLFPVLMHRPIGLLPEPAARRLITEPALAGGVRFTDRDVAFLLDAGGRHPKLLTLCAEYLFDRRRQAPQAAEVLPASAEARRWAAIEIAARPAVAELFRLYLGRLSDAEREVLTRIATGATPDAAGDFPVLAALSRQSMVYVDPREVRYRLFSDLFRDELLSGTPAVKTVSLAAVRDGLTPLDRRLWDHLQARPDQVCGFDELRAAVWGNPGASKRGLDAAIHRLRERIAGVAGDDWDYVQNVRGKGFKYVPRS